MVGVSGDDAVALGLDQARRTAQAQPLGQRQQRMGCRRRLARRAQPLVGIGSHLERADLVAGRWHQQQAPASRPRHRRGPVHLRRRMRQTPQRPLRVPGADPEFVGDGDAPVRAEGHAFDRAGVQQQPRGPVRHLTPQRDATGIGALDDARTVRAQPMPERRFHRVRFQLLPRARVIHRAMTAAHRDQVALDVEADLKVRVQVSNVERHGLDARRGRRDIKGAQGAARFPDREPVSAAVIGGADIACFAARKTPVADAEIPAPVVEPHATRPQPRVRVHGDQPFAPVLQKDGNHGGVQLHRPAHGISPLVVVAHLNLARGIQRRKPFAVGGEGQMRESHFRHRAGIAARVDEQVLRQGRRQVALRHAGQALQHEHTAHQPDQRQPQRQQRRATLSAPVTPHQPRGPGAQPVQPVAPPLAGRAQRRARSRQPLPPGQRCAQCQLARREAVQKTQVQPLPAALRFIGRRAIACACQRRATAGRCAVQRQHVARGGGFVSRHLVQQRAHDTPDALLHRLGQFAQQAQRQPVGEAGMAQPGQARQPRVVGLHQPAQFVLAQRAHVAEQVLPDQQRQLPARHRRHGASCQPAQTVFTQVQAQLRDELFDIGRRRWLRRQTALRQPFQQRRKAPRRRQHDGRQLTLRQVHGIGVQGLSLQRQHQEAGVATAQRPFDGDFTITPVA